MPDKNNINMKDIAAYCALTLASAFWAGNYAIGKLLGDDISAVSLTYYRWFPAMIILCLIFYKDMIAAKVIIRANIGKIILISLLGIACFITTLYKALQHTTALNTAIYYSAVPIIVTFINRLVFKDQLSKYIIIGAFISLFGVIYLLLKGSLEQLYSLNFNEGDIWAIISTIFWSSYCSSLRLKPKELESKVLIALMAIISIIALSPIFVYELMQYENVMQAFDYDYLFWIAIIYLIFFPSITCYFFWNFGLDHLGSAKGSVFVHAVPLLAAILGVLVLGEIVELYHIIGSILIISGLIVSSKFG